MPEMAGIARSGWLWTACLALLTLQFAAADDLPDPSDVALSSMERVEALIERMRIEQKGFDTLHASFEQHTASEMLVEAEAAKGAFYYRAPDQVRWEYFEPTPKIILIDGGEMTTFYQDLRRAEILRVGRHSDRVLKYLGASGSLETLMEYFTLRVRWPESAEAAEPYRLQLSPRYERIAKRIEAIDVEIDSGRFIPVRLHYTEPSGDETEYVFADIEVNEAIPNEKFELVLPADVEVRRRQQP
jgi:outer membrane lipoprotein carrier protein